MSEVVGHNAYIGLGREAVWGTDATITDHLRIVSEGIKRIPTFTPRESLGDPTAIGVVRGMRTGAGPVRVEWLYEGMELLLEYLFGNDATRISTDDPVPGANTWTYTPQKALYLDKGLTLEKSFGESGDGGWSYTLGGGKINSIAFEHVKNKTLQATCEGSYKTWTYNATPSTPNFPDDYPVLEDEFTAEIQDVEQEVDQWSCTIANSLSTDRAPLGALEIKEQLRNALMSITGSFVCDFTSNTLVNYINTGGSFKFEANYATTYFITGSTPYELKFEFPECYVLGEVPGADTPGVIQQTVNWMAVKNDTAGYAVKITLISGRSALPAES